jgi:hypothetical protein
MKALTTGGEGIHEGGVNDPLVAARGWAGISGLCLAPIDFRAEGTDLPSGNLASKRRAGGSAFPWTSILQALSFVAFGLSSRVLELQDVKCSNIGEASFLRAIPPCESRRQ